MKQRVTLLDICALHHDLQSLIGLRCQNIYDTPGNAKLFVFKFAKPSEKKYFVVESGFRCNLTTYDRQEEGTHMPHGFTMKMRKFLRTKRCNAVYQLGYDRIIVMEFGEGESKNYLVMEFYASGNVILLDKNKVIQCILRSVNTENIKMVIGEAYSFENARYEIEYNAEWLLNNKSKEAIKKYVSSKSLFPLPLVEHVCLENGIEPSLPSIKMKDEDFQFLLLKLEEKLREIKETPSKGFLYEKCEGIYEEYHPIELLQLKSFKLLRYERFELAMDEFYMKSDVQKLELKAKQQEEVFNKKLESIRKELEKRIENLEMDQKQYQDKAMAIENNLEAADEAIKVVQSALMNAMDWKELEELIQDEKEDDNPIALLFVKLKLERNRITLKLDGIEVDLDISMSAFANAQKYYDMKRQALYKHDRTINATKQALKNAEIKIKHDLKQVKVTTTINKVRKPFWFEKFSWFISSENYLVLAGRDMQQNELLVKRHLRKGDLYVHADIHGAGSVIIKNPSGNPVPPATLNQAGCMSVCQSRAWDAKIVTSAYFVYADQVSKTAPSGEYLGTGSFMIRGKKNYLSPTQLVYGFGFLFKVDESCISRHLHERRKPENIDFENFQNELSNTFSKIELAEDQDEVEENKIEDLEIEVDQPENMGSSDLNIKDVEDDANINAENDNQESEDINVESEDLDAAGDENSKEDVENFEEMRSGSKKRISAKERKMMKKGKTGSGSINEVPIPEKKKEKQTQSQQQQQKVPRGKSGKKKKMLKKYSNQDEEERELRMSLLQSAGKKKEEKKPEKKEIKQKLPKEKKKESNIQEVTQIMTEENIETVEDINEETLTFIDSLTGCPQADDIILFAIPVCAPYSCLSNYKFKVKLTPGSLKKGKASKMALNLFLQIKELSQREKEVIKAVPENELINQMLGKVKVSAPQFDKLVKDTKKKKKRSAKSS
ncbi:Protein of unknown function DUF3441 domain-containing protein [Rozella allomycis CSF55]|uniref:Ribosome quality control complex subunit 2 n=1 Tax=Rozella allomycis (strain CSF55) TaxID=988480 RepID=A0A075B2T9_ROZAC|nr:Protein of unknown function DUF3441 domain-containing protein [Rozella allomycis CSF55]|eukprot:EPZ35291.1 Protein of unknown function DUF3441 domain-containing protein [Rozella allomycis CSF55]